MARTDWLHLYLNRRMAVLLGLGFASGLPLSLTGRTLRIWARDAGMDLTAVGLFGLVTLPYTLKFIWAPVMDRNSFPLLGRRRGWLVLTQLLVAAAMAAMALAGPHHAADSLAVFAATAVAVAFFSASQDIVADAYRTDVLTDNDLGAGASIYMTGYRLAMLASGAGAVLLADHIPWRSVYLLAAAGMGIGVACSLLAPAPPSGGPPPEGLAAVLVEPLREFVSRNGRRAALVLLFVVTFKLPDYMAAAMTDPLLLDIGFSKTEISLWALGVGTAVTIPGAVAGGLIVTRCRLMPSLLIFGLAQALSNAGYLVLAKVGRVAWIMWSVVGIEYFCAGLVVAGFVAFLMSQCNRRFSATQYALLSSLMGVSSSLGSATSGYLAERVGYTWFFTISIAAAAPGMLILPFLRTPSHALEPVDRSEAGDLPERS